MMNAVLVLALWCQDGDLSVSAKAKREDREFELTISGKGRSLQDQETVTLRLRRLANRLNWTDGAIVTEPTGDELRRMAQVDQQAFVVAERFPTAGEVEVRVSSGNPESGTAETSLVHRVFRVASATEEAHAIASDAGAIDSALRHLKLMLDDLERLRKDPAPPARKQARLERRVDWRKNAYRQELAHSYLSASARALALWIDDVEQASELEQAGKESPAMLSSLTGAPFSWEAARDELSTIETASLRERALLIVLEVGALVRQIAAAAAAGDARSWAHHDRDLTRALDVLRETDGKFRIGPFGGPYASHVDLSSGTLGELIVQAGAYLRSAEASLQCAPSNPEFEELGRMLTDRIAAFEVRLRTQP
jgi:hypothetical protein